MDMHIADWNPEFLGRLDVDEYVEALKNAGAQAAMVQGRSHTGLAYYPTKLGKMHPGLKGFDFLGAMIEKCHKEKIAVVAYFTQIFDNWAYEEHPDWRMITGDGMETREFHGGSWFRSGRYGIVCPNHEGYRAYLKAVLTEALERYDFEGIFLDMTFFPEVCFCPSCRKKYKEATGKELIRRIDRNSKEWTEYIYQRDQWIAEFAHFVTDCIKSVKPQVTVEHQFSRVTMPWTDGSSELIVDAADYSGGDYYGGFLQQTFINKYYKNVSANLPFIYHTSRCDPDLLYHTTTKAKEELLLHVITALAHNGAFLLVDAMNPDGSIAPSVYHTLVKEVFQISRNYEHYVSGKIKHDAAIWFASHAKYDPGDEIVGIDFPSHYYLDAPIAAAAILRENNIPFDVIGSRNILGETAKVLILSHIANIRDEEMDAIEAYLERGGNLLVSGPIGNERLQRLLGVRMTGRTKETFSYMAPTKEGKRFFQGFDTEIPLTVDMQQTEVEILEDKNLTVLATVTLPYTMPGTEKFAAIHSNPPGIHTEKPCALLKQVGKSRILWTAAPIELSKPYMSRQVFKRMIEELCGTVSFYSNAPKSVEVLEWEKDGKDYFAIINEQEEPPITPVYDLFIEKRAMANTKAYLLPDRQILKVEQNTDTGMVKIFLPKLEVFQMICLEEE